MANTLTALANVLYSAAAIVPRKLTGMAGAVRRDFDDKNAALGDTVKIPFIAAKALGDYTPAMTTTAGGDTVPTTVSVTLDYNKEYTWNLTGDEERQLNNGGDNAKEFMRQNVEQGIGALVNHMEATLCTTVYKTASRAYGTAGTAPFSSVITDIPQLLKILADNGVQNDGNISLVVDTTAGMNLRSLATISNSNTVSEEMLRSGVLAAPYGVQIRESAQFVAHTAGTGSAYDINGITPAVGATLLPVDTGSGTVLVGDVITNLETSRDANKYVVKTGIAAAGDIYINDPGLRIAWADGDTIGITAAFTPNTFLHRNCAVLVTRNPDIPSSPLIDQIPISDPVTGMTFLLCRIVGDGMYTYRLHALYGTKAIQSDGIAILLG